MLLKILLNEKQKYVYRKKKLEKMSHDFVEGNLIISKSGIYNQYYYSIKEGKINKRYYIKKDDYDLLKGLTYKKFILETEKMIEKRIRLIEKLIEDIEKNEIDDVYDKLPEDLKKLVKVPYLTNGTYLEYWKNKNTDKFQSFDENLKFITNRGEKVRSKSEKIIADALYRSGAHYKYEEKLKINEKTVYPDFTIYVPSKNKIYYWEHFGMMDNKEYLEKALLKIEFYESIKNIEKIFYTFETREKTLNINHINNIIQKILN